MDHPRRGLVDDVVRGGCGRRGYYYRRDVGRRGSDGGRWTAVRAALT